MKQILLPTTSGCAAGSHALAALFVSVVLLISSAPISLAGDEDATATRDLGTPQKPYSIPKTTDRIKVDGLLDEAAWGSALTLELKYEIYPGENVEPPVRTEVLLIYSRSYLYVGFRAYDPDPAAIRAHLRDRDSSDGDDNVSITFDTFNDERRAFSFACNPLGIQTDNIVIRGRWHRDLSWDAIWDSAGVITDWGYAVEMAIPFNVLRFPRANGKQIWGLFATRSYPRNVRHELRNVPNDRSNNCSLCQAAKIEGFEGISPGRSIELTPTLTALRTDGRDELPDGPMQKLESRSDAGLSASWGITPNFTLNATINPDFSNVEADSYQLDINKRFTLRYPEKRPFFLGFTPAWSPIPPGD